MISHSLTYERRPWTTNAERSGNRWERARLTREWRGDFRILALETNCPAFAWCDVEVELWHATRRGVQDTGACHPAVKAAIDGIVDAGVLLDDTPDIVRSIKFHAPKIGRDAVILTLTGEPRCRE